MLLRLTPVLLMLNFFCNSMFSQQDTAGIYTLVLKEARKSILANYNNDVEVALTYVHPELYKPLGGIDALRKQFYKDIKSKKFTSISIIDLKIKAPKKIVLDKGVAQCAFAYTIKTKSADTIANSTHNVIGISDETLKKWYFLDVMTLSLELVRFTIPIVSAELSYLTDEATEEAKNKIEWEIEPFLVAKEITHFSPRYGQVIFREGSPFFPSADKMGMVDVKGQVIYEPKKIRIWGYEHVVEISEMDGQYDTYLAERKLPQNRRSHSSFDKKLGYNYFNPIFIPSLGYQITQIAQDTLMVIDQLGTSIIEVIAKKAEFKFGRIHFNRPGSSFLLNPNGEVLIPEGKFTSIEWLQNGYSTFARMPNKDSVYVIDTTGKILNALSPGLLHDGGSSGFHFSVYSKDKQGKILYGIVNHKGIEVIKPKYKLIKLPKVDSPLFAAEVSEGQWKLYNFKEVEIWPEKFDNILFSDKYLCTVDKKTELIRVYALQDLKLLKTLSFKNGSAFIDLDRDEKSGKVFINIWDGKLYPIEGEMHLEESTSEHQLFYGSIAYKKDKKYGLISTDGKHLIPPVLDNIAFLKDSYTIWGLLNGKWGLLKIKP